MYANRRYQTRHQSQRYACSISTQPFYILPPDTASANNSMHAQTFKQATRTICLPSTFAFPPAALQSPDHARTHRTEVASFCRFDGALHQLIAGDVCRIHSILHGPSLVVRQPLCTKLCTIAPEPVLPGLCAFTLQLLAHSLHESGCRMSHSKMYVYTLSIPMTAAFPS